MTLFPFHFRPQWSSAYSTALISLVFICSLARVTLVGSVIENADPGLEAGCIDEL